LEGFSGPIVRRSRGGVLSCEKLLPTTGRMKRKEGEKREREKTKKKKVGGEKFKLN
jgi:hypothetical protein